MRTSTLFLISVVLAVASSAANASVSFSNKLIAAIVPDKSEQNVVFSPASIASCLALTYLGAAGETASELQQGLELGVVADKQRVAQQFGKLLDNMTAGGSATLRVVTRAYVNKEFAVKDKFNELAERYFHAEAETVEFRESEAAASQINAWVQRQTDNKIQRLVSADSLNETTSVVLVNAVYFKANWARGFKKQETSKRDFFMSKTRTVPVDMMYQENKFPYGKLHDLDATAVELSYLDTDIKMLVLLPNSVDGLPALERKLQNVDLTKLSTRLYESSVYLRLPKFRIEFDISLQPTLEQLGIKTMFTKEANFTDLVYREDQDMYISEVRHKAFVEVDEQGTEAAGATLVVGRFKTMPMMPDTVFDFNVDHPFFFALKDKETVYFVGHVSNF